MIIKAGTYRFNDVLNQGTDTNLQLINPITFTVDFNGELLTLSYMIFGSFSNEIGLSYGVDLQNGIPVYLFDENVGWALAHQVTDGEAPIGFGQIINITEDFTPSNAGEEAFATWFTSSTTMLIKAGTYRWNDTLSIENTIDDVYLSFSTPSLVVSIDGFGDVDLAETYDTIIILDGGTVHYGNACYYDTSYKWDYTYQGFIKDVQVDIPIVKGYGQIITVTIDTYTPTIFGLWANENWKKLGEETTTPAVEITYKGEKIELSAGDVATLHIKDHKLTEDLVIKANATGGGGSCSGNHIIEVTELPTENIDENAVYDYNGSLYRAGEKTFSLPSLMSGEVVDLIEMYSSLMTFEKYYSVSMPTENIVETDISTGIAALYYIEDVIAEVGDVAVFAEGEWMLFSEYMGVPCHGVITNKNEVTSDQGYYIMAGNGLIAYKIPTMYDRKVAIE